jgi:hypothetical protein
MELKTNSDFPMKKRLIPYLIILVLVSAGCKKEIPEPPFKSYVLNARYNMARSESSYTNLTGGTVLLAGPGEPSLSAVAIGFSFKFYGIYHTQFVPNVNGFITFGATAPPSTTDYSNFSLQEIDNCIAPFMADLYANQTTFKLRYSYGGLAPNRVCTIEWFNIGLWPSGGNEVNFQLKLYEIDNSIVFHYHPNYPSDTYQLLQIGLNGLAQNDFLGLRVYSGYSDWNELSLNTVVSSVPWESSIYPTAGTKFVWTPRF